ncbi:TPA: MAP domain-containing protein [Staphylococcus pseudintermedius]|nr:MAP domain-containing protein [Staphylococcus pseudintermedius]EGQ3313820.1 MAP domain-containing protein [Staphylococcus pseudintermedius]HDT9030689.1 MAP domain-containing protein [Staphylococcus pseudintermedius]
MKAKKLLATGLALGILTSTASLYTDHEAQAASKQHHQVKTSSIPYSTTIDGATPFVQSYLKLSNEDVSNFKQLNQKVKSTLKQDYKISATQIEKSKTAQYTVTWKNGKKQTISLKNDAALSAQKLNVKDIQQIDIVVKNQTAKQDVKSVPYTVTIDGQTAYVQSFLNISNKNVTNFYQLNQKVKSALNNEYQLSNKDINRAKTAKYTVTWNNGKKQTINLKSHAQLPGNQISGKDIKNIDIEVVSAK